MYYNTQDLKCVTCKNEITIKTANKIDYSKQVCMDYAAYKLVRCPNCDTPMREVLADSGLLFLESKPASLDYLRFNKLKQQRLA